MDIEQIKDDYRQKCKEQNEMPSMNTYLLFIEDSLVESLEKIAILKAKLKLYQSVKECKSEECECGC